MINRTCKISEVVGGRLHDLTISFLVETSSGEDRDFEGEAWIRCPLFEKRIRSAGIDQVQAIFGLFGPVLSFLRRLRDDGYTVYWLEDGDLEMADFWGYRK